MRSTVAMLAGFEALGREGLALACAVECCETEREKKEAGAALTAFIEALPTERRAAVEASGVFTSRPGCVCGAAVWRKPFTIDGHRYELILDVDGGFDGLVHVTDYEKPRDPKGLSDVVFTGAQWDSIGRTVRLDGAKVLYQGPVVSDVRAAATMLLCARFPVEAPELVLWLSSGERATLRVAASSLMQALRDAGPNVPSRREQDVLLQALQALHVRLSVGFGMANSGMGPAN